jgi:transcriptional regulator with XRE-family HTH domain
MPARSGHVAPFLDALRTQANLTTSALAAACGVSVGGMSSRLHGPGGMSLATLTRAAIACGATSEQLTRLCVLDAMDRGALLVPSQASEEQVHTALSALVVAQA